MTGHGRSAAAATLALLVAGAPTAWRIDKAWAAEKDRPTPSGLPVPRYVSLKFADVNARAAPEDDSRLLWTYHVKGLPVQVVAETAEWRRICDPEGGLAWVHKRTTDGRRMVMRLQPQALPIHSGPKPEAGVRAYLQSRALADLDRCKDGWCKIKVAHVDGWIPAGEVWGAAEAPQCR